MILDLEPATRRMAALIGRVPNELLGGPTPCPAYCLGDLIDHVGGLALAFTAAAHKTFRRRWFARAIERRLPARR